MNQSGDDTTPEKRHCSEAEDADKDWLPKGAEACMAVDHDEGIGTGRRMNRLGKKHVAKSEHLSERIDPQQFAKALIADHANQRTPYVAAEQCAWLGSGHAGEAKQKDRRAAQRCEQERGSRWADEC